MNFLQDIKPYDNAMLPGVRLPQISIESKYYDLLSIPTSSDNFTFLKTLCYNSLNSLGLNRYCCRRNLITNIDMMDVI